MGTRTAIFKEMSDGSYKGIYVHSDGYISYTGAVLDKYYTGNDKIEALIENKKPISTLGEYAELVNIREERDKFLVRNEAGFKRYTTTNYDSDNCYNEYYKAENLEEIINFQYLTYDEEDNVQGFFAGKEFVPFRGSDNNGYLYLKDKAGQWYVSYMVNDKGDMSAFEPLSTVLKTAWI